MQQQHVQNNEAERQDQRQPQGNAVNPEDAFPAWAGGGMGLQADIAYIYIMAGVTGCKSVTAVVHSFYSMYIQRLQEGY